MGTIESQITSLTIVYSTVYRDADQTKHQSSASLAFVWGIHRGLVNSPHKWLVMRKMFPFDDVIMFVWKPAVCFLVQNCTVYDCDFHISIIVSQITGNWTVCSTPWSGYIKENIHAPYTSMKTSKQLHITGPCEENSLVSGFPSQRTSNSAHPLRWRHSVSNHQPHNCLLNRLFGCRSKKTSKLRVTGLCASKYFHLMTSSCHIMMSSCHWPHLHELVTKMSDKVLKWSLIVRFMGPT